MITITPFGMSEGLRGIEDGIVYFGCKKKEGDRESLIINDFLLPLMDK